MGGVFVKSGPFLNAGCIMYSINIFISHFTYLGDAYAPNAPPPAPPAYGPTSLAASSTAQKTDSIKSSRFLNRCRRHMFSDDYSQEFLMHNELALIIVKQWHIIINFMTKANKKLSYRRGTARCVVSVEVLPIATQRCRNYLYDKS